MHVLSLHATCEQCPAGVGTMLRNGLGVEIRKEDREGGNDNVCCSGCFSVTKRGEQDLKVSVCFKMYLHTCLEQ